MIDIANLRVVQDGEWTRLVADISSDFERKDHEKTIWFAVRNENADILTTDVYNMFLFYPVYMAMYYKSDLHLHGKVSKRLYCNINTYLQAILCAFSEELQRINVITDGFGEADGPHNLVGTGISGGVDCLATIYTHFQTEIDEDAKINSLFMTNFACVEKNGDKGIFLDRCEDMRRIADALGLPFYEMDTNLETFLPLGDRISYFALYSCAFAMEKALGKYYISSSLSYGEILQWHNRSHNRDWSEFADPYAIPLMESGRLKLISDGCQFTRSEKTELISDWNIAQEFLYVCSGKKSVVNCCECTKCKRTLLPLEAMGKLDKFSRVFDLNKYKSHSFEFKCNLVLSNGREVFSSDNYKYCKQKGMKLPSQFVARLYTLPKTVLRRLKIQ